MTQRGGSRAGAGRKPGSATKKTREIANREAEDGITPLEVMLRTMRLHWDNGQHDEASKVAEKAAPYMHPKLAAVEHSGPDGGPVQSVTEIRRSIVDPRSTDPARL